MAAWAISKRWWVVHSNRSRYGAGIGDGDRSCPVAASRQGRIIERRSGNPRTGIGGYRVTRGNYLSKEVRNFPVFFPLPPEVIQQIPQEPQGAYVRY